MDGSLPVLMKVAVVLVGVAGALGDEAVGVEAFGAGAFGAEAVGAGAFGAKAVGSEAFGTADGAFSRPASWKILALFGCWGALCSWFAVGAS